jgi:8-oxo-dGTP diphosphatase
MSGRSRSAQEGAMQLSTIEVKIYDIGEVDDNLLKFSVIAAKYKGRWIFCRHKERSTWEIPGGHRELGETILETAERELNEETGAVKFSMNPLAVYSVRKENETTYGELFFSEIESMDVHLKYEIEKIDFFTGLPEKLTYPEIQPVLYKYAIENNHAAVSMNTIPN